MPDTRTDQPPVAASWVDVKDMPTMPMGWYWAEFPGSWEFYKPARDATLSIDHGDNGWHKPQSSRYWGPWTPPAG